MSKFRLALVRQKYRPDGGAERFVSRALEALDSSHLQLNVINLFDEQYYSNLGTRASATPGQLGYSRPFAGVGAPRTVMASIRYSF